MFVLPGGMRNGALHCSQALSGQRSHNFVWNKSPMLFVVIDENGDFILTEQGEC